MSKKTTFAAFGAGLLLATGAVGFTLARKGGPSGEKIKALNLSYMDSTATPATDFFQYVDGKAASVSMIPATESRWGAFSELAEKNRQILREILEESSKDTKAPKGSTRQMVGDFYYSGMDSAGIEKQGIQPIQPLLSQIKGMKTSQDVINTITSFQKKGIFTVWGAYVDVDSKNSLAYAFNVYQSGLSLPNRDYYLEKDKRFADIRNQYAAHVSKMLQLSGEDQKTADADAQTILKMETALAEASMKKEDLRNPYATYNKYTLADASKLMPELDFATYTKNLGIANVKDVIVGQPEFFKAAGKMIKSTPVADWQTYLKWHVLHQSAPYLSSKFVEENFHFYSTTLSGVTQMQPRWKRVMGSVDNEIGMALGQEYVKRTFTPEAKESAVKMVNNLMAALKDRISQLEWMSPATKQAAMKKVNSITVKIGYPDKWQEYTGLKISRNSYFTNIMRADSFEMQRNFAKMGKPVDRTEWGMTPPTVNAYYNPTMNEIVFPAGILQYPFFNPNADDAVNYGGIGAVIGHELTHGFDDEGRQFDADGNMNDWWTADDAKNFNERTKLIEEQFGLFKVPVNAKDSASVNGKLTLGENIADLGGLTIAYAALQKALEGKKVAKIDGLTQDQRFFFAWAQVWRAAERPEYLAQMVQTNPHSPSRFRVNGPLSNMDEFKQAFGLKDGDPMVRPANLRARIW
jgi:putative endopeptidase